ncbi:MAG TPA: hypothetical protein VMB21_05070, partial [Candidatus Limnocylindria bacterium]|nr:hypothetical protein [Candidatus Limnocylindria bacterium]
MNLSPIFKRLLTLFACAGLLTFASARLLAAEHAAEAPAAAEAHLEGAPLHHTVVSAEAKDPTWYDQALYSYLTAFMFCLSIVMGGMFLVIVHYLFDAGWSVPIRRINEQIACLIPYLGAFG